MRLNCRKIILAAVILLLIVVSIAIISAFQRSIVEQPSLVEDTRLIRASIKGFIKARNLEERLDYVSRSSRIQRKMRTYLVFPFSQRRILDQEIEVIELSSDAKRNRRTAVAKQKISYLSETDKKVHRIQITFKLEKHAKWLISDFDVIIIKK